MFTEWERKIRHEAYYGKQTKVKQMDVRKIVKSVGLVAIIAGSTYAGVREGTKSYLIHEAYEANKPEVLFEECKRIERGKDRDVRQYFKGYQKLETQTPPKKQSDI